MVHQKVLDAKERGKIEWQMWANVLAVCGGSLLILGGIIGQFGFENSEVATFSIVWGVIVSIVEWPRSKRLRGNTLTRAFQGYIVPLLSGLGKFWRNLYFRTVFYIGGAIPTFFCLPCVFGGVVMIVSGGVYIKAAFKGEQWKPLFPRGKRGPSKGSIIQAPTYAPPRRPDTIDERPSASLVQPSPDLDRKPVPKQSKQPVQAPPSRPVPKPRGGAAPKRPPPQLNLNAEAQDWSVVLDDESGKNYYYNQRTNETTWDMPTAMNPTYNQTTGI
mmetsp:Transcript_123949/g.174868  ORF Transcript_123949/g.174868 Transcript_123949/m.174868 type:complete len:273 (-) Transcript_123949:30-848(-)